MKFYKIIHLNFLILLFSILSLAGCQSIWNGTVPDNEIVYQGEGIDNSAGHMLGFIQANGDNNQVLKINKEFEKPVWSDDGKFLYGLSDGEGSYMGYPAYWDLQKGRFGICNRNLPYYFQIQGSGNPENPYEVIVHNLWTIIKIDIARCKQVSTLVDYSDRPGDYSIAGFSYSSSRQELVFGLVMYPDNEINREYRLMMLEVSRSTVLPSKMAEGINPSWSPDGTQVAYIGLDGLYILAIEDGKSRQIIDTPYFDPLRSGNPHHFVTVPSWSPDGEWLIYHRCDTTKICSWKDATMYTISSEGGQEAAILFGGEFPNWRH